MSDIDKQALTDEAISKVFAGTNSQRSAVMRDSISHVDDCHLSVRVDEIVSSVPTFPTKNAAMSAGAPFGWRTAVRIERRFENVWVVGKKCFQSDHSAGLNFDAWRFPLLRWEKEGGVTKCPVLSVRRFKPEAAQ